MRLPSYPVRGNPVTAAHGRAITDAMREIRDRAAPRLQGRRGDLSGFPWDQLTNGYTITSATQITLVNLKLQWGKAPTYTCSNTAVTIAAVDPAVSYVGIAFDGTTLSVPAASTSQATFLPDDSVYRTWLFGFVLVGSGPQRVAINQIGRAHV